MNAWTRRTISVAAAWLILGIAAPASGIAGPQVVRESSITRMNPSSPRGKRYELTAPDKEEDGTVPKHGGRSPRKARSRSGIPGRIVSVTSPSEAQ
jgi:hypothetical protein